MSGIRVTEKKTVKIGCCIDYPVYLCWINKLGGFEYWLFGFNWQLVDDISIIDTFNNYVEELSVADAWQEVLQKQVLPSMIVGADNVDTEDIDGIRGALHSVRVQMLLNPTTWTSAGPQWQTVTVKPGSFKIKEARGNKASIEITIMLQELIVQRQ